MREGLAGEQVNEHQRRLFAGIGIALSLLAVVIFAYADLPLAPQPAFLPTYASAVVLTDLITAYLVFAHAPLSRRAGMLPLGAAYLYSGSIVIGQMLVFPGVWSEHGMFGAGPQSAVWLWVFWHGGFPALVLLAMASAWTARRETRIRTDARRDVAAAVLLTLLLVGLLVCLAAYGHDLLPELIVAGNYRTLSQSWPGRLVLLLNLAALGAVLYVTRGRRILDLGLALAALASLIDAVLTLHAGARFSLGWYVARVASVISAFSVLAVYLAEITWLYARVLALNARLEEQASVDSLTGVANRRFFDGQLEAALRDAQRTGRPVTLLLIDVDHFKRYNDSYGHLAGDGCLRKVAIALQSCMRRPRDVAARYGGEEFAAILPETDAAGGATMAARVIDAIRALQIEHKASATAAFVTASIGIATSDATGATPQALIKRADEALYAAKGEGRNRAVAAGLAIAAE
jgi:diguanylate cyclase (GGDEF)-like protein